jgi:hypothetical protein
MDRPQARCMRACHGAHRVCYNCGHCQPIFLCKWLIRLPLGLGANQCPSGGLSCELPS